MEHGFPYLNLTGYLGVLGGRFNPISDNVTNFRIGRFNKVKGDFVWQKDLQDFFVSNGGPIPDQKVIHPNGLTVPLAFTPLLESTIIDDKEEYVYINSGDCGSTNVLGMIICLNFKTGELVWYKDLTKLNDEYLHHEFDYRIDTNNVKQFTYNLKKYVSR